MRRAPALHVRIKKREKLPGFSWEGLEHLRDELLRRAEKGRDTHAAADKEAGPDGFALGYIAVALKNPDDSFSPTVRIAAEAHNALYEVSASLVKDHRLDCDFVRREIMSILNPIPEEAALCDRLVASAKKRRVK
jgi:hypothetical protein